MKKLILRADKRQLLGRKVKALRKDGLLPANIYGKKIKSQAIKVAVKDFMEIFKQVGETGVVEVSLGSEKTPYSVLIHNLQVDPVSGEPLHADLRNIDLLEKVEVAIPVELVGDAPGVTKGGILVQVMNEVEVEALPTDLPDKFEVDISGLEEAGQSILVKDLKVNKDKIKVLADEEQVITKVEAPKEEKEEVPAVAEAPETPEGEAKPAEEKAEEKPEQKEEQQEK